MKKTKLTLITVVLLFLSSPLLSQTTLGRILVGGESSLSFEYLSDKLKSDNGTTDLGKSFRFDLEPLVGYFVMDNLAVGASLPISYASYKDETDDKTKFSSIGLAPFARYYFGETNIKPYGQVKVGYGIRKIKDEPSGGTSTESKANVLLYGIGGGVGLFMNDQLSLNIGLEYGGTSIKQKIDNEINAKNVSSGISFRIGIVILISSVQGDEG